MHFTGWHHFCTSCRNPYSGERSQIPGFFEVNEGFSHTEVQMCDLLLGCSTLYFCSNVVHMETFQTKKVEEEEEEEKEKEDEEEKEKKEKQQ